MPSRGPTHAAPRLAVIMPCLNEADRIDDAIARLHAAPWLAALVVVDGGSTDGTQERIATWERRQGANGADQAGPNLITLQSPSGRGSQLRAGAAAAIRSGADVLLFVHADCTLPADVGAAIARALRRHRCVGGAFRIRTVADELPATDELPTAGEAQPTNERWWLRFADLRARYTRLPYGDQAVFVRSETYLAVGGFPDQPLMEDLELARRLRRQGELARLPQEVLVSGRRFLAKPFRSFVMMNTFPLLYRLGVSPEALNKLYGHIR